MNGGPMMDQVLPAGKWQAKIGPQSPRSPKVIFILPYSIQPSTWASWEGNREETLIEKAL
jgi:hypothetical protein